MNISSNYFRVSVVFEKKTTKQYTAVFKFLSTIWVILRHKFRLKKTRTATHHVPTRETHT